MDEDSAAPGSPASEPAADAREPEPDAGAAPPATAALAGGQEVTGRVIGWNDGGFHVALGDVTAFCPKSEMDGESARDPQSAVDRELGFVVLRVQDKGRRVVVSRRAFDRRQRSQSRARVLAELAPGSVITGSVASLTSFGAFVDLGGVQGLLHVSELSHGRVRDPSEVLAVGDEVEVQVLRVEESGKRISLSRKALEPDLWKAVRERFPVGAMVEGTVERSASFGAFVQLEPGLVGLLPAAAMALPRESSPPRAYPPGKQVRVQVVSVDPRRRRISLGLEGSTSEGTRADFESYRRREDDGAAGFGALAAAFEKLADKKRD